MSSKLCNALDNTLLNKNNRDAARSTLDSHLFGIRKNQFMEKMTITYKKPNLESDLKREVFILDNFQQSIFNFEERFLQTKNRAGWKKKEALAMLFEIVSDDILFLIEDCHSVEDAFKLLYKAKYSESKILKRINTSVD